MTFQRKEKVKRKNDIGKGIRDSKNKRIKFKEESEKVKRKNYI